MLQHALQICTVTSIFISVDADVMLALNVEELRYLANKFLSKNLAEELTKLVSQASQTKRIDIRGRTDTEEITEVIAGKRQRKKVKHDNKKVKRFKTVNNKQLLRDLDDVNMQTGPVYVKDELDSILNDINGEDSNGYNTNKATSDTFSNEVGRTTRRHDLLRKPTIEREKIDYTETKLGEWRYNHVETKKPVEMKNIKIGNLERDNQGGIAYDKVKNYPGHRNHENSENNFNHLKRGIYIVGIKHEHTNKVEVNDQQVDEEDVFLESKPKYNPKRKPQVHLIEPIEQPEIIEEQPLRFQTKGSATNDASQVFEKSIYKNKLKSKQLHINTFINDPFVVNNDVDNGISSKHIMKPNKKLQKKKTPLEPIDATGMFEQYALNSRIKTNNNGVNQKLAEESEEKEFQETNKRNKDNINQDDMVNEFSNNEKVLLKNKKRYFEIKGPKNNKNNLVKGLSKGISAHHFPHSDEENSGSVKPHHSVNHSKETGKEKIDISKQKLLNKPIEENDLYEKNALGTENQKRIRKGKQHSEDDNEHPKSTKGVINTFKKYYESLNEKFKDSNYCKRNPNSDKCKQEEVETINVSKELVKAQQDSKEKLGSKVRKGEILTTSVEVKGHRGHKGQGNEHDTDLRLNKKNTQKWNPIEDNDLYTKFELGGGETEEDKRKENKQRYRDDKITQKRKPQNAIKDKRQKLTLGSKKENNNIRVIEEQLDDNYNKTIKENINIFDKDYEFNNNSPEKTPTKSTKWQSQYKDSYYCKKNPNSDKCKEIKSNITSKESAEGTQNESKVKIEMQKDKERYSTPSAKSKGEVTERNAYDLASTKLSNKGRNPHKTIDKKYLDEKHARETDVDKKDELKNSSDVITTNSDKINKNNDHDRYKDENASDSKEITSKNKKEDKDTKVTKKYEESKEVVTEAETESIKALTENLLDDSAEDSKKGPSTRKFTMKGTFVPKRDFYKLSSPDYYKDIPREVEKYDFNEPIPERDREPDKIDDLKIEPARINQKVRLTVYDNF